MEATLGATRGYAIVRIVSSTIGAKGSDLFRENFLNLLYRNIWRGCQEKNEKKSRIHAEPRATSRACFRFRVPAYNAFPVITP
jgi:hypothetical protein